MLVTDSEAADSAVPKLTGEHCDVIGGDIDWYTMLADHAFERYSY